MACYACQYNITPTSRTSYLITETRSTLSRQYVLGYPVVVLTAYGRPEALEDLRAGSETHITPFALAAPEAVFMELLQDY